MTPTATMDRGVQRVIDAVTADPAAPRTLEDMGRIACYSRWHFARVFRRHTGVSPDRYIAKLRIDQAKHLLATTGYPISRVITEVGYTAIGSFGVMFKNAVGMTPTAYRRAASPPEHRVWTIVTDDGLRMEGYNGNPAHPGTELLAWADYLPADDAWQVTVGNGTVRRRLYSATSARAALRTYIRPRVTAAA